MKENSNKTKVLILLIVAIIVAGIVVTLTLGFNFDLRYQDSKKIEIYLNKEFTVQDIKQITDEVMPNENVIIQKVEVFEDTVIIIAKDITEEQKDNVITKINEKYQTDLATDQTEIVSIPNTRGRDILKPYMVPFAIATVIILLYIAIRYYKLGAFKAALKSIIIITVTQAVLFSLIAITRIPIGRLTIPMMLVVYMLTIMEITTNFERKIALIKEKEENNTKKNK